MTNDPTVNMTSEETRAYTEALRKIEYCRKSGGTVLDLSNLGLTVLPKEIIKLTLLTHLRLSKNRLSAVPSEIGEFTELTELDLVGNQLSHFPLELCKLTKLTELYLQNTQLNILPPEIGQFTSLKSLNLSVNQLRTLPPEIGNLTELAILRVSHNQLHTLPKEIGRLTGLRLLNFGGNQLMTLPREIGQLAGLRDLLLRDNQLITLPPEIGSLVRLLNLQLGANRLRTLPLEIGKLAQLTELGLERNQLWTLPPQLGELASLTDLELSGNPLTTLLPEIGKLSSLTRLYLIDTQLAAIPPEIGRLEKLERLVAEHNALQTLPIELTLLPILNELFVYGNEALGLPMELLGPTWAEERPNHPPAKARNILDYYFRLNAALEKGETRPLNEAKVLFLGQPEAGKSSLIHGLRHGTPTPNFPQTDGIDRERWLLNVAEGRVVGTKTEKVETLRLNLWDFGGQEIYKATHTYFLTKRALYVIVTTARKDADPDLEEWLETAKTFGGGAPVWVVVNKHDENPTGGPDEEELTRKYYPMLRGFIRTQCQHTKKGLGKGTGAGLGLNELRDQLVAAAWAMDEVRLPVAKSALDIKEHLEGMDQPTLTLTEYRNLCVKLGEFSESQQQTLLGIWDKLGTVRYFPDKEGDEPEFQETAILNPDWVTEAVYRVLMDPALKAAKGLVTDQDLARITRELKHTSGTHHLIRKVMCRFSQLYYTDDNRMFVPHLLENREPKIVWPSGALRFVYKYPVLPAGLIPAFIAKMHQYHDPKVGPWLKGCLLRLQGCRIRVIGDRKGKTLEVEVQSDDTDDQRDALDQVRYTLESMHSVFANGADVDELIPVPGYPEAPMVSYRLLRTLEKKGIATHFVPINKHASNVVLITIAEALGGVRTLARARRELAHDERFGNADEPEPESVPKVVKPEAPVVPWWKSWTFTSLVTALAAGVMALVFLNWDSFQGRLFLAVATAVFIFMILHNPKLFFRKIFQWALLGWMTANAVGVTAEANMGEAKFKWDGAVGTWFNVAFCVVAVVTGYLAYQESEKEQ